MLKMLFMSAAAAAAAASPLERRQQISLRSAFILHHLQVLVIILTLIESHQAQLLPLQQQQQQQQQQQLYDNRTASNSLDLSARIAANDEDSSESGFNELRQSPGGGVSGLFGQVAKTVIYGGAALAQLNSPILCPLLKQETEKDNDDKPILFAFNNNLNKEQAYRIYSDDEITEQIVEEAQFDPDQMTVIFVHGWLGGIQKELWLSEAKNAALESSYMSRRNDWPWPSNDQANYRPRDSSSAPFRPNVIIVDWSEFAAGTLYQATQNSYKVSRRLARLLGQLAEVGQLKPDLMHCLGHSIGTHICGRAARQAFPVQVHGTTRPAERRFGRITGLDPGGFCYELDVKNETTFLGLRPSDALLVDAYYSNRSPFGNKFQVAQYNVRVNNGFFQKPCSVWKNPEVASDYFRAAMRWAFGGAGSASNEVLTCDHYFSTRFAQQFLPRTCSYVGYHCDSYRNYLRGKCGQCDAPSQCYSMDFQYQTISPSIEHALKHIRTHSSFYSSRQSSNAPLGGVPYEERRTYFLRIADEEPYCSPTFRVRVALDAFVVNLRSFKADYIKLRLFNSINSTIPLKVKDASRAGRKVDLLPLHGPWSAVAVDEKAAIEMGLDERTLTALFELDSTALHRMVRSRDPPIEHIQVEYNNELNRRQDPLANPIDYIQLDYLSSTDLKTRSKYSRLFRQEQFSVVYKHLERTSVA